MSIPTHPKEPLSLGDIESLSLKINDYIYQNFHDISFKDTVSVQVQGMSILFDKEDVIYVNYMEKGDLPLPKVYIDKHFKLVEIDGEMYYSKSPQITKAIDTRKWVLKKKAYESIGGYYEEKDNLLYKERDDQWIPKEKTVVTKDTEEVEYAPNCYYTGKNYYRYRDMAAGKGNWGHAPYTKESIFPKEIKERRIGIEYEFGDSFNMFEDFLKSDFKYDWNSVRDGSLDNIRQGIEFVSIPFKLEELDRGVEFIDFAKAQGATISDSCGYHVHIGASDLNFMDISNVICLGVQIEASMFKLGGMHRENNTYCKPLSERFRGFIDVKVPKDKNKYGNDLYKNLNASFTERHKQSKYVDARGHQGIRYYWLNIDRFFYQREKPEQKTVEFRNHIATWDSKKFYNYCLLCYYIVEFAKNHSKKTCMKTDIYDIANSAKPLHRKQLNQYLTKNL